MRIDQMRKKMAAILKRNQNPVLVADFYSCLKLSQLKGKLVNWDPITGIVRIQRKNRKTQIADAMFVKSIKEVNKVLSENQGRIK